MNTLKKDRECPRTPPRSTDPFAPLAAGPSLPVKRQQALGAKVKSIWFSGGCPRRTRASHLTTCAAASGFAGPGPRPPRPPFLLPLVCSPPVACPRWPCWVRPPVRQRCCSCPGPLRRPGVAAGGVPTSSHPFGSQSAERHHGLWSSLNLGGDYVQR